MMSDLALDQLTKLAGTGGAVTINPHITDSVEWVKALRRDISRKRKLTGAVNNLYGPRTRWRLSMGRVVKILLS